MFLRASYFCVLSMLIGITSPSLAFADFEVKPVPFNAERFAQEMAEKKLEQAEQLNIQTVSDIEPAAGPKSPEPYYMVTVDSLPVNSETDSLGTDISMPAVPAVAVEQNAAAATPRTIIAGQKLNITVDGESDLSKVYPVQADGSIAFPLLGKVNIADLSAADIQTQLTARLKDGYLVNPKVSVAVISSDPIFVLGDVLHPGAPIYSDSITISSAIQSAGGYEKTAKTNNFQVLRTNDPDKGLFSVTQDNQLLESGDILIVKGY